jgi:ABC-type Zn uptake system ZnuABC Zn-binding protein ZnuA
MSSSFQTRIFLALLAVLAVTACKPAGESLPDDGKKRVVATTTMIEGLAAQIGGDDIKVAGIMRPGGDPHLYQPTPADARIIAESDLVLTNGLKLEGWIDDLVRNAGGDAIVRVVSVGVAPLQDPLKTNYPDPHFWHAPSLWKTAAANTRDALIAVDPDHAAGYRSRAAAYILELEALDDWAKERTDTLPKNRRTLVTSHDAFQYFGRAYGFEVVAIQGMSTQSEAGARDVARVVDIVRDHHVPAIFVESSVNPKLIEQVSRETGVQVGGTLYSDSLGTAGGPGGTYIGMIKTNVNHIVDALGAKVATSPNDTEEL